MGEPCKLKHCKRKCFIGKNATTKSWNLIVVAATTTLLGRPVMGNKKNTQNTPNGQQPITSFQNQHKTQLKAQTQIMSHDISHWGNGNAHSQNKFVLANPNHNPTKNVGWFEPNLGKIKITISNQN